MITCSICGNENGDFDVVCASCKSFLQSKVDNLNLFETLWGLIESPRSAFKRIVLSHHKNYVLLLSSLFGISLAYMLFWYKSLGILFSNVLTILGVGLLIGPPLGILFVLGFSYLDLLVARALGGSATFWNTFAVVAYAGLPIILSLVFVFPIEIALFGRDFFGTNPPPIVIKPIAYVALIGFDLIAVICTWLLLGTGTMVVNGFKRTKSILVTLALLIVTGIPLLALRYV